MSKDACENYKKCKNNTSGIICKKPHPYRNPKPILLHIKGECYSKGVIQDI